ncbi:hypothetical protein BDP55DRAFT_628055 [Colletotrichum godetiae]|uniref:Uncharacterized protein n=1 Tax=Colletotrichum godetiae TaxID=1209918 RepID=A0AAJ0AU30_9PEZI|nr:uncharacterized protein BDP55DRAFT_628055 [Colletotrichum godetiae]KAK1690374.1 hypothetical protein BDP55DRAFT_628055 [Colletotrichum godetiae]
MVRLTPCSRYDEADHKSNHASREPCLRRPYDGECHWGLELVIRLVTLLAPGLTRDRDRDCCNYCVTSDGRTQTRDSLQIGEALHTGPPSWAQFWRVDDGGMPLKKWKLGSDVTGQASGPEDASMIHHPAPTIPRRLSALILGVKENTISELVWAR